MTLPASSYLHLKAPTEGHDHNAPTLCGRADPGIYAYASATSEEAVNRFREESKNEPRLLCPECDEVFKRLRHDSMWREVDAATQTGVLAQ